MSLWAPAIAVLFAAAITTIPIVLVFAPWSWIFDSLEPPVLPGRPSTRHFPDYAMTVGRHAESSTLSIYRATIEIRNAGPARAPTVWVEDVRPVRAEDTSAARVARILSDALRSTARVPLAQNGTVEFPLLAVTERDTLRVFTFHAGDETRTAELFVPEGDHYVLMRIAIGGYGRTVRRTFRLRLEIRPQSRQLYVDTAGQPVRLSTYWPGSRWAVGSIIALLIALLVAGEAPSIGHGLIRGGLVMDVWGVLLLAWGSLWRNVLGTGAATIGGSVPLGDGTPAQRQSDRETQRSRMGLFFIVSGFMFQLLGQI